MSELEEREAAWTAFQSTWGDFDPPSVKEAFFAGWNDSVKAVWEWMKIHMDDCKSSLNG